MLIEQSGKFAFVRRAHTDWMDGYYGLPSGKVEKGEGFLAAAVREAQEEIGVIVLPEDADCVHFSWRREPSESGTEWCDVLFRARTWTGEPRNVELDVHDDLSWFALDALPENVVPPVRTMLQAYERGELYSEYRDE